MSATFAFAQADKVVATVNGQPITGKQLEEFAKGLPNQFQQFYQQDKEAFLKQYSVLLKFSKLAEAAKVDQMSPYKQRLEFTRLQLLSQAYVENYRNSIAVKDADVQAYYDKNKDNYTQAKLQVILVNYSASPAKEGEKAKLTEDAAKTKADGLVKQIRAGADFKKLAAESSDDVASKAKGGDFGTIRRSDQIPDELKKAIFVLKAGECSEPVKQPNGFYIFKVVELTAQPLEEVKSIMTSQLRDEQFQEWLKTTQDTADAKVEDPAFFGKAPAAPPAAPKP